MKKLRVLHVASFTGNIGDNASHIGLNEILKLLLPSYDVKRLEIRKFYKNYSLPDRQSFDESFVNYANTFDLLLIGGGGFLDYWVPNSATGTTIDISYENLEKLSVPTLICSVGSIPHRKVPEGNIEKFRDFLSHMMSKKNINILLRNDGSKTILTNNVGKEFGFIPTILDNGFFFNYKEINRLDITKKKYISFNTTTDQLKMMKNNSTGVGDGFFLQEIVQYFKRVITETDYHIVMIPHIYSDINAFDEILTMLPDFFIRERIHIAPYSHGEYACNMLMSLYHNSSYNVGMRFHSNVCSLAMNKPISGLAVLDRVKFLHQSVGSDELLVDVSKPFATVLFNQTVQYGGKQLSENIMKCISIRKTESLEQYKAALNRLLV